MSKHSDELSAETDFARPGSPLQGEAPALPAGLWVNPDPQVSRDVQDRLGATLRDMYAGLVAEPVPDRFADLIRRLSHEGSP